VVPNKVEVEAQESDKLIKSVFKGVIHSLDNGISLNILSRVLARL